MLKRRKPLRSGIRQNPRIRSAGHLQFVRGFVCSAFGHAGHECEGKIEAHHCRKGTDGAIGEKPGDEWAIPACRSLHQEIHDQGEERTERKYGINLKAIAEQLWRVSPHRKKLEAAE